MKREDWSGLTLSVLLHLGALLWLSVLAAASPEPEMPGYVEVEFGAFAEGRPASRAQAVQDTEPRSEPEAPQPEEAPSPAPENARPVDLPDPEVIPENLETVQVQDSEVISPTQQAASEEVEEAEEASEVAPLRPLGSGDPEGATEPATGEDGTADEDERRAPFQIEGLNRQAVNTVLPRYTEQVNADIRIQIVVGPSGRILRRVPLIKGNPALEKAVMEALLGWRFNPLPPGAPQENQTGIVTFRFRLR
jgi:protein TonB